MINPWFKFYGSEYLSDPKIGMLDTTERSAWVTLLCLASTASTGGFIEYLNTETLLERAGVKRGTKEWDDHQNILQKFSEMGMIVTHLKQTCNAHVTQDVTPVEIKNWGKRQDSQQSVTERVRKHRLKQRILQPNETNVTVGNANDNGRIEKNRIEKNRNKSIGKKRTKKVPDVTATVTHEPTPKEEAQTFFRNVKAIIADKTVRNELTAWLGEIAGDNVDRRRAIWNEVQKFTAYWTEKNKSGTKERWETEKTWEWKRRMYTWFSRAKINTERPAQQQGKQIFI